MIEYHHFGSQLLPRQKEQFTKQLRDFSVILLDILVAELNAGNKILWVWVEGKAGEESVHVNLALPFFQTYKIENIGFVLESDPHYSAATYRTSPGGDSLNAPV